MAAWRSNAAARRHPEPNDRTPKLPPGGFAQAMTATRIATAAVLIPLVTVSVLWGPLELIALLAAAIACLALIEFFALVERAGLRAYRSWTLLCSAGIFAAQWAAARERTWTLGSDVRLTSGTIVPIEVILLVFTVGMAVMVFSSPRPLASALGDIGASATALVFIALPLSVVVRLHGVERSGPRLLLFTLMLVWAGDTMAYFVGKYLGHLRMAPKLSAAKTWEGAAANLVASLGVGAAFTGWLGLPPMHVLVMAGLANVAGQVGDLLESAYKRSAGVKDSGSLLPGHGGMLDRIDALILAAPVVWYYFDLVLAPRA
jgi:phosphatidate cytidylyltransferase